MARRADRLAGNVEGEWFVDASCIDCDLCRQIAPETFARSDEEERSIVARQPAANGQRRRAAMALVACPTSSIGGGDAAEVRAATREFPEEIAPGIHSCGFASEDSFGASSYLIRRERGNVLVDSPRAARPLLDRIAAMGGVGTLFLTHRDDVADHARFHERFGCARVMHRHDLSHDTRAIERPIDGVEPVRLDEELVAIPVPGHTRGSAALLYREEALFTGDHLWWDEDDGRLHMSRSVCWYSWSKQVESLRRLLDFRFEWVLPGHGRRWHAPSAAAMREMIERTLVALR
jgi:glyoxylase-like metal-dependent hydrolase (beta-lactamase superfamily II)/ferredoxin